jgi:hypothetical protein
VAIVTSIACDVVARTGNPLSRQSTTDLSERARGELNKPISRSTARRILDEDAIKSSPRNPTGKASPSALSRIERVLNRNL